MSIEQQLVQSAHASHEVGISTEKTNQTSSLVIIGCENQQELTSLLFKFNNEVKCYPFFEPYKNTGLTSFATEPIPKSKKQLFKEFKLWKPIITKKEINYV